MKDKLRVSGVRKGKACEEARPPALASLATLETIAGCLLAAATRARERLAARRQQSRVLVDQLVGGDDIARWVWLGSARALADPETLAELLRRSGDRTLQVADRDFLLCCLLSASLHHGRLQRSPRLPQNALPSTFLGLAELALEARDFTRTESMLNSARSTASVGNGDPLLLARSTLLQALILWNRRQFRSALGLLARVGRLAQDLGSLDLEAQALTVSLRIQRILGNFEAVRIDEAHLRQRIPREVVERVTQQMDQLLGPSSWAA